MCDIDGCADCSSATDCIVECDIECDSCDSSNQCTVPATGYFIDDLTNEPARIHLIFLFILL